MDTKAAEQTIRDLADEITAEVRAKGYEKATIEFWIGSRKTQVTWIFSDLPGRPRPCGWSGDLAAAAAAARALIAELEDARAYDADLSGPLFLMSEQPLAQAAE